MDVMRTDVESLLGSRLGLLKDSVFAVGGVTYVLGYLAWSYYAWRYRLGPVPALKGQYFVAGVAVLMVIGVVAVVGYATARAANVWWPTFLASRSSSVRRALFGLMIIGLVLAVSWNIRSASSTAAQRQQVVSAVAAVLIFPFVLATVKVARRATRLVHAVLIGYVACATVFGVFHIIEQYYPVWPQELGGARPRYGYLTLRKSDASGGGLRFLRNRAAGVNRDDADVFTTSPLYVLVRTDEYLVVAQRPPNRNHRSKVARFEVPLASVVTIVWIDD